MLQTIQAIRKMMSPGGGEKNATDLEARLRLLDAGLAKAKAALNAADEQRGAALLGGEAAAKANRAASMAASDDVAAAEAARLQTLQQIEAAYVTEAATERRRRYERAMSADAAVRDALLGRLPKHINEHNSLIRLFEEARAARDAANAELPPGCDPIGDPENEIRDCASLPREVVSETREIVWTRTDVYPGQRIDPSKVRKFTDLGGGVGQFLEKRDDVDRFVRCLGRVDISRDVRLFEPGEEAGRLRNVEMPGFRWFEPGYKPVPWPNPSVDDVLGAVARAEEDRLPPDPGKRFVRTELDSEPIDTPAKQEVVASAQSETRPDASALPPPGRGRVSARRAAAETLARVNLNTAR